MEYYWNEKNLKEDYKILINKIKNEKDFVKKAKLRLYADELKKIIELGEVEAVYPGKRHCMGTTLENIYSNSRYIEIIKKYNNILERQFQKHETSIDEMGSELIMVTELHKLKNYSLDECLEIAKEFFGNLDNTFYRNFLKIYNNRYKLIKESKEANYEHDGVCTFVGGLNKPYIWIDNVDGLQKVATLIHELGHATMLLNYPDRLVNARDSFGTEIESILFEIIYASEFLDKDNFEKAILNYEYIENYESAKYILIQEKITKNFKGTTIDLNKEFYRKLKEKYKITHKEIDYSLYIDAIEYGQYIISYMIALEIYNIFKQDKKEALKILRRFAKEHKNDTYQTINKYIPDLPNSKKELENKFKETQKIIRKELKY